MPFYNDVQKSLIDLQRNNIDQGLGDNSKMERMNLLHLFQSLIF